MDIRSLVQKFDLDKEGDISSFLILFERQAKRVGIEENDYVFHLLGLLPHEITNLIARESEEEASNYAFVKNLLLKRFKLSPEKFRQKFANHTRDLKNTWSDFVFEIRNYFNEWLAGLKINDFDSLKELIITDQLKKRVPNSMREHFIDSWPNYINANDLAQKLDEYENVRSGIKLNSENRSTKFPGQYDDSKNYSRNNFRNSSRYDFNKFENRNAIDFELNKRKQESKPISTRERKSHDPRHNRDTYTACELFTAPAREKMKRVENSCIFCDMIHSSDSCKSVMNLSLEERKNIVLRKGACFNCLKVEKHLSRNCPNRKAKCDYCSALHHKFFCFQQQKEKVAHSNEVESTDLSNQSKSEVFLQTLIVSVSGNGFKSNLRLIIDTGSQNTYISKYAAKMLKLVRVETETIKHGLFGGVEMEEKHNRYRLKLSSLDGKYNSDIEALDVKKICSLVPRVRDEKFIEILKNKGIYLSDVRQNGNRCLFEERHDEIHLLLGADTAASLFTSRIEHFPKVGISAFETKLGWTLMGRMKGENISLDNSLSSLSLSLFVSDAKLSDLWRLDTIGISNEENKTKSMLEEETQKHFLETVKKDNTGRYEVTLPWIVDNSVLSSNRLLAENFLYKTETKLINSNKRKEYGEIFDYWEDNEIIEEVKDEKKQGVHFLPHRPVIKESSETTKIRPVFNASAHSLNSPSLNDCLAKGPNLIKIIPSILNRFRKYRIGISSDIEKAFCQIKIAEKDRDFLRFFWFDSDNKLKIYRHSRVVFGLTSSPFLLAATLNHLLNAVPEHFVETSQILKESFYIDNSLVSVDQIEETEKFIHESKEILASAHFNLRCWRSNMSIPMIAETEDKPKFVPVLGLTWDLEKDSLSCKIVEPLKIKEPLTKRELLSVTQKIYDPIGFTAPVTLVPKMILQQTWILKIKWNEELPVHLNKQFSSWMNHLPLLTEIEIPRWLNIDYENEDRITLHIFSDASKHAYATCAYIRAETEEGVKIQLVNARSRVAPIKEMTIPRLELLSCLIGARLAQTIISDLKLKNCHIVFWSDSTTALGWIRRDQAWGTFVHNRVQEIRTLTKLSDWRHVPGSLNPADLPSRGCSFEQLKKSRWWEGPQWLYLPEGEWPQIEERPDEEIINKEKRKTVLSLLDKEDDQDWYYRYFSSYRKTVRMIAWILRFSNNLKNAEKNFSPDISVDEFEKAEKSLYKLVQKESFTGIEDSSIRTLRPIEDENGIFRAKTNIIQRKDKEDFRYPVILPSNHPVIKRMIFEKHLEKQHAGVSILMAYLRENVWILKSRKTVRNVIRQCVRCKRFNVQRVDVEPGIPPEDRVREGAVFEVVGVDLAGPLHLSDGSKSWIVLFTCAIYRAIHLELVTSLSTESFLQSLRRFIARRGRPYVIYSDNGTNFTGTNRALAKINWNELCAAASTQKIRWKFNPPTASWWGGWWERLVRMIKEILRRVLGKTSLNYEELNTILCDCEQVINSRPITYVSEDNKDPSPLTPMMFLQELPSSGVPDIDTVDSKELNRRARYRQRIRDDLRNRFRSEYLGQLRQHALKKGKFKQMSVGDVVLVEDINKRRIHWPLARIIEVLPGKDHVVRLARVQTENGTFLRPIPRLFPLEITDTNVLLFPDNKFKFKSPALREGSLQSSGVPDLPMLPSDVADPVIRTCGPAATPPVVTRSGRIVKPPVRYLP